MALILSQFAQHVQNTANGDAAGDVVANDFYVDLKTTDLLANNTIDLGVLPAGHTVTDAILIPDDMDTGTTITLDVGVMSGFVGQNDAARTVGTELFAATTAAQTGTPTRVSAKTAFIIPASPLNRSIGVKIVAAPTGATAGRLRLRLLSHAVKSGMQF